MSDKDLKRYSKKVGKAWWYEEPDGVHVIVPSYDSVQDLRIPWKQIRAALERKDKK